MAPPRHPPAPAPAVVSAVVAAAAAIKRKEERKKESQSFSKNGGSCYTLQYRILSDIYWDLLPQTKTTPREIHIETLAYSFELKQFDEICQSKDKCLERLECLP